MDNFSYRDNFVRNKIEKFNGTNFTMTDTNHQKLDTLINSKSPSMKKYNKQQFQQKGSMFLNIFSIIMAILLVVMLIRYTQGGYTPSFTGLLTKLSTAPVPEVPFINTTFAVLGDWGAFNFIRDFIRLLLDIVNVGIFFANGIMAIFTYIIWLLQWVFIG